jgi:hypothetical protein
MKSTLKNISYYTPTHTGTASPMRYSFTYEVKLYLIGTATTTRYSYNYEVQL